MSLACCLRSLPDGMFSSGRWHVGQCVWMDKSNSELPIGSVTGTVLWISLNSHNSRRESSLPLYDPFVPNEFRGVRHRLCGEKIIIAEHDSIQSRYLRDIIGARTNKQALLGALF